jgi:hypothetical protein
MICALTARVAELEAEVARILNAPDYDSACDMGKLLDGSRDALARSEARCGALHKALERCQFSGRDIDGDVQCVECGGGWFIGHVSACSIGAALTGEGAAAARVIEAAKAETEAEATTGERMAGGMTAQQAMAAIHAAYNRRADAVAAMGKGTNVEAPDAEK